MNEKRVNENKFKNACKVKKFVLSHNIAYLNFTYLKN